MILIYCKNSEEFNVRSREPGQHPMYRLPLVGTHLSRNVRSGTTVFSKNSGKTPLDISECFMIGGILLIGDGDEG
jgi:hypothetical protein